MYVCFFFFLRNTAMIVGDYYRSSTNEAVKAAKLPWRKGPQYTWGGNGCIFFLAALFV